MQIEMGLFDHMVLQRNARNVSDAAFAGTCTARGPVVASVKKGTKALPGFAAKRVGAAARGRLAGRLDGLPPGGPYTITLSVGAESLTIRDVLVGDVWLLGGQSNMQGCGLFPKERLPTDPQVRAFYMDDRWAVAQDPIHNMWLCVDPVHIDLCGGARPLVPDAGWGVCPGPAFANTMRRETGVPQGLIACAHGGTSMEQWDPARRGEGGKSLYGALVRRLNKNGRRVAGVLWYQGCSDANAAAAPLYTKRMRTLVRALRRDAADRALPVVIVQIARVVGWGADTAAPWNSIQDQQRRLPDHVPHLATVPAIDLPLDDGIHISGAGHYVLGVRLAQAMRALREGRKAGPPPIALKQITTEAVRGMGVAVVEFANVVGALHAASRPSGFAVVNASGAANHFDIQLDGPRARIRTMMSAEQLREGALHYGYGTDPYCNITDEAGRSLPVFGPVRLGKARAITGFIRALRVSAFQPSAGKLEELDCPAALDALHMAPRTFAAEFCNLHPEIAQHGGEDRLVYYACRFACAEPMRLALVIGYDGPVKVWVDGALCLYDPNGVNPATVEKASAEFAAGAGTHELIVALGTNHGLAWGVFLRLERMDVTKHALRRGPEHYTLPQVLG